MADVITEHCVRQLKKMGVVDPFKVIYEVEPCHQSQAEVSSFALKGKVTVAGMKAIAKHMANSKLAISGAANTAPGRVRAVLSAARYLDGLIPEGYGMNDVVLHVDGEDYHWNIPDKNRVFCMFFIESVQSLFDMARNALSNEVERIFRNSSVDKRAVWCFETSRYFVALEQLQIWWLLKEEAEHSGLAPAQVQGLADGQWQLTQLMATVTDKRDSLRWYAGQKTPITVVHRKGDHRYGKVKYQLIREAIAAARNPQPWNGPVPVFG